MTNAAGICIYLNPEWERFLGHVIEPRDSEHLGDDIHPDDCDETRASIAAATTRRDSWEVEYRIRAKAARYRWLLTRGTPRFTADGGFEGYVGSATDITARKEENE